jgi:alpha-L-rhamnosidase
MKRLIVILSVLLSNVLYSQPLTVANPRCENRIDPIGVDAKQPRFSWELVSEQQNVLQTAYRIMVSDNPDFIYTNYGNCWDSKKVTSSASIQVQYRGSALKSAKSYYWKVMVWDNKGHASPWSALHTMTTGLFTTADWKGARWIAYDVLPDSNKIVPFAHGRGKKEWGARKDILPLLRKTFTVHKPVRHATAFVCGLGQFEFSLNGKKIGDHFLDPGWTQYSKQALYVGFDIKSSLREGENAIGVALGNGFYYIPGERYRKLTGAYGYPKMISRIFIEYTDGTSENIISDGSWTTAPSPVTFSSIYGGEDYDATLEQEGWDSPGFNHFWRRVKITDGPTLLQEQSTEPVRRLSTISGTRIKIETNPVYFVTDFRQNFSGVPVLTLGGGNRGDTVRIIPGELLNEDGTVSQRGSGGPHIYNYIVKGNKEEHWAPQFTYYGFRYVQAHYIRKDTTKALPDVFTVEGSLVSNSTGQVGEFTSSHKLFNQTNDLIKWAIRSNMMSVFTDCPHREKLGWLEQNHLVGSSVQYNYDIATLCRKIIRDMMMAQTEEGLVPEIAPEYVQFEDPFRDSPEWGSAAIILPWYTYEWYGDKQILSEAYGMMKKYIGYLQKKAEDNILSQGLGDWYDLGPNKPGFSQLTPKGLTATATYYYDLMIMDKIATLLNKPGEAAQYRQLGAAVKNSFNKKFYNQSTYTYGTGSQTANAMALFMNLVEPANKDSVVANLIRDIRSRNNALTAGDIGYRYVLRALEDANRSDVIFDMNSRDDVPGYGFQIKNGATALTESWQALPSVSNNHFMLGHLMEWFYAGLCGIKQSPSSVAFNKIEIRPQPVGDIKQAAASYKSVYGLIKTDWKIEDGMFTLNVTIPPNTTATIFLPSENYHAPIKVGSGNHRYTFKSKE